MIIEIDEAKRTFEAIEARAVQEFKERIPLEAIARIVWGTCTDEDYTEVELWLAEFGVKEEPVDAQ